MTSTARQWRILVSGVGSIGERHIRNLIALGQSDIALHRIRGAPLRTINRQFKVYNDLVDALTNWAPEIVFVTGPTNQHMQVASVAAEAACHIFVEKPLGDTLVGVDRLRSALAKHKKSLMVGYMLRFHPLFQRVQAWLHDGTLGRPLHWRSSWGEYLPDWHPWEDYRTSYAARRELGGGPALTFSHDIDIALWLFGEAKQVCSLAMPSSPLNMNVPTGVDLLVKHTCGVLSNIHLDFWQRPPQRNYEIIGSRGRATLDYVGGTLTRYSHPDTDEVSSNAREPSHTTQTISVPTGWDRNSMFVAELEYFLGCLAQGVDPEPGLKDCLASTHIASALSEGGYLED